MITVLQPGALSTIQDEGRADYLAFGLPRAGVMDRVAAHFANLLCGNPLGAAVIEMTLLAGLSALIKIAASPFAARTCRLV